MAEKGFTILLENSPSQGGKQDKVPQSASKTARVSQPATQKEETTQLESPKGGNAESLDEMFNLAREWTGHPYLSPTLSMRFGDAEAQRLISKRSSSPKKAIDCSGFAQEVLSYAGIDPPGDQTAEGLFDYFKKNGTQLKGPQKGALVFFEPINKQSPKSGTWDAGRSITHVAFSMGGNRIMDSSSTGKGVSERDLPPEGRFKYHYVMPRYKFGGSVS